MEKVRIGVIGLGRIFHRVMADLENFEGCELYALAARDLGRAQAEAERYHARKAYGSYEELVSDPDVELVYIATPHVFHKEHTLLALEHGKHVICEKPFALNAAEAEEMVRKAREKGLFLMEAMWTRFLPAWEKLRSMKDAGELGTIRNIQGNFAYAAPYDRASRLYAPELAGGALMDVGIYLLSMGSYLLGDDGVNDVRVLCRPTRDGVDGSMAIQLSWENGASAQYFCAVDTMGTDGMKLYTDKMAIDIPHFWYATSFTAGRQEYSFPPEHEGHAHQFVHAAKMIRHGRTESEVMPLDETLRLMRRMDAIRRDAGIRYPGEQE